MGDPDRLVSRLEIEPLRKVFPKEAQSFTKWLEEHIEALADRIGMELTVVQREKMVGDFSVDLLCEGPDGKPVIIENQLERTDHDHLGKLLTYLVNLGASTAIWVTAEPRPEHHRVIEWLNEITDETMAFYLVKVEATRIGDSPFAPLFTVVAGPNREVKVLGEKKKEWADRHFKRLEFWKSLLERSREKTRLFSTISPGRNHWISTGAGKSGVTFAYSILMDSGAVELYIDHDQEDGKGNKAMFDALKAQQREIEAEIGASLTWQRLDEKRACRIYREIDEGGLTQPETWPRLQDTMIDTMIRFEKALRPRLANL